MDGMMLGKIASAEVMTEYGHVYFQVDFSGEGWGVGNSYALMPGKGVKEPDKWVIYDLAHLMETAKVSKVSQLVGKPVEIEFEYGMLKSWRILKEVL